jgi:hypothetical protein
MPARRWRSGASACSTTAKPTSSRGFTSYGTQQWLAIKVAWYRLGSEATTDPAAGRLAAYLQEQYQERVLDPVVREVDPAVVRETATRIYQRTLGAALTGIRQRHAVPADQFDRRLQRIPAISLAPPPAHDASLHQFIHADPLAALPAYGALLGRIRAAAAGSGGGADDSRLSPAARRASEQALARLTASGAASAAAAIIGGVPGAVISLGAFGVGLAAHEKQRPEIETQLRANLDAALAETWHSLIENRASSVMAAVHYLATRIDDAPHASTVAARRTRSRAAGNPLAGSARPRRRKPARRRKPGRGRGRGQRRGRRNGGRAVSR